MPPSTPLEVVVESLLGTIPDHWSDFDHDALSKTEQQALFLLVAAGLVERRVDVRGEFAGEGPTIEFTIDATGEYGIVEALESVVAELWTRWGPAFEAWKASDAKGSTPFRFTKTGLDRWRLSDQGVMARGDLDIQEPSRGAAADVGPFQRTIDFVTRGGRQADRPPVRGEGRLVEMTVTGDSLNATPGATPVSLVNSQDLAAAFRDLVAPAMAEALRGAPGSPGDTVSGTPSAAAAWGGIGDADTHSEVPPLTENEVAVINTLAIFDPSRLASGSAIEEEMSGSIRLSRRTIQPIVMRLIELGLAERPRGERSGVRLTLAGRRLAPKLAD